MKFTKMQGIGNDYVYVNCFEETIADPSAVARFVSDRHFGIGSDGLILVKPSDVADCEMDMYNLDGSEGFFVWQNSPTITASSIKRILLLIQKAELNIWILISKTEKSPL